MLLEMSRDKLKPRYIGSRYTVIHCKGAIKSFEAAAKRLKGKNQRQIYIDWINAQIERLADGHRLSADTFPDEGLLPRKPGRPKQKFKCFKKKPIRGYCWNSDRDGDLFYISHYIFKNWTKLDTSDIEKVGNNWSRIEIDNDIN